MGVTARLPVTSRSFSLCGQQVVLDASRGPTGVVTSKPQQPWLPRKGPACPPALLGGMEAPGLDLGGMQGSRAGSRWGLWLDPGGTEAPRAGSWWDVRHRGWMADSGHWRGQESEIASLHPPVTLTG